MFKNPPLVNGVMDLSPSNIVDIKAKLTAIQEQFTPTDEEEILSVHGLVSRYNIVNPEAPINGDTAQFIISYEDSTPEGV